MHFSRVCLRSQNKSSQMSPATEQPNLINTEALLTLHFLTWRQSYVLASAECGGRGANSYSNSQGKCLKIITIAQRISCPFPCKLLFWESSASLVLIKLRWNPRHSVCFMAFSKRNFVFKDFRIPAFKIFLAALKTLPLGGGYTHINIATEGRTSWSANFVKLLWGLGLELSVFEFKKKKL